MKIEKKENIYLAEYDIHVIPYLTYAQIQAIANECIKYRSWEERKEVIQYMVMVACTDADKKEIEDCGSALLEISGCWDAVFSRIENYNLIQEAISYEESMVKQLEVLVDKLPQIAKEAVEKAKAKK